MDKRKLGVPLVFHGHSRPVVNLFYGPITPDGIRLVCATEKFLTQFFAMEGRNILPDVTPADFCPYPFVAMVVEGEDAISKVHQLTSTTERFPFLIPAVRAYSSVTPDSVEEDCRLWFGIDSANWIEEVKESNLLAVALPGGQTMGPVDTVLEKLSQRCLLKYGYCKEEILSSSSDLYSSFYSNFYNEDLTFILIRPMAFEKGCVGHLLSIIENMGFCFRGLHRYRPVPWNRPGTARTVPVPSSDGTGTSTKAGTVLKMDANATQSQAAPEVGSSIHPTSVPVPSADALQAAQGDPDEATTPAVDVAKKPKSSSKAWKDFIKLDEEWAQCKHCHKKLKSGSQKNGTSGLWKHLRHCTQNPNKKKVEGQQLLMFEPQRPSEDSKLIASNFSQEACRKALVVFIIVDEKPFKIVEGEGFRVFCQMLEPRFKMPSRMTIYRDLLQLYLDEKVILKRYFASTKMRVSLTTDTWTSPNNYNYICVTVHFIDQNWKLQKRIILFCQIEGNMGSDIGQMLERCLLDWGLEDVFGVTLDNASANTKAIEYLKQSVIGWTSSPVRAEYLHVRCAAHVLAIVTRDAVRLYNKSICRISRWNSTYLMLKAAEKYEKVFKRLEKHDRDSRQKYIFEESRKDALLDTDNYDMEIDNAFEDYSSSESEGEVEDDCNKKGKKRLTARRKSLVNMLHMKRIGNMLELVEFRDNATNDPFIARMADIMFRKSRGDFKILFEEYKSFHSINEEVPSSSSGAVVENSVIAPNGGRLATLQSRKKRHKKNQSAAEAIITELDMYLMEVFDESELDGNNTGKSSFDILAWWKANSSRYKILSCIAKDILAMSVSSVASESAFSTGKRVLSPWRSSLSPRTVEALLCCQSWLSKPIDLDLLADYVPDDNSKDEEDILGVVQLNQYADMLQGGTGTELGKNPYRPVPYAALDEYGIALLIENFYYDGDLIYIGKPGDTCMIGDYFKCGTVSWVDSSTGAICGGIHFLFTTMIVKPQSYQHGNIQGNLKELKEKGSK
ncbi:hypothetical protein C5167_012502 [Papaver somniferum]|uniref:BED-type domain-containing protein n=1 Tax=Papaver somniferum TaxID=3469 RepID=A0A4Y7J1M0_PAPSO|nr:hypothetical protein C5167_012502 [Papaver somniferum]